MQLTEAWLDARRVLDGLTDDEYLWEPVSPCWSVRRRSPSVRGWGSGEFVCEDAWPAPDPLPATTIAWRVVHLAAWTDIYRAYAFEGARPDLDDAVVPPDVAAGTAWLLRAQDGFIAHVAELTDESLFEARPAHWGESVPVVRLVTTMLIEHVHHLAEVGALRDLRRGHAISARPRRHPRRAGGPASAPSHRDREVARGRLLVPLDAAECRRPETCAEQSRHHGAQRDGAEGPWPHDGCDDEGGHDDRAHDDGHLRAVAVPPGRRRRSVQQVHDDGRDPRVATGRQRTHRVAVHPVPVAHRRRPLAAVEVALTRTQLRVGVPARRGRVALARAHDGHRTVEAYASRLSTAPDPRRLRADDAVDPRGLSHLTSRHQGAKCN